jgi:hypothetical protein
MTLTECAARRLIGVCAELLNPCSNVIGQLNPAIGALIAMAREEALTSVVEGKSSFDLSAHTRQ